VDWNQDAIEAAKTALRTVNEAVDAITLKAAHLESLLVLLAHAAQLEDLPALHRETVCWLGTDLAREIGVECSKLASHPQ
jgi:predicted nucleotidyltransferase